MSAPGASLFDAPGQGQHATQAAQKAVDISGAHLVGRDFGDQEE